VAAGLTCAGSGAEAFIWDAVNNMRNLREVLTAQGDDLTGWTLRGATGVTVTPPDGKVLATYEYNPFKRTTRPNGVFQEVQNLEEGTVRLWIVEYQTSPGKKGE